MDISPNTNLQNEKPDRSAIINAICLLEKFPGKGGWTYAEIPTARPNPQNPFGWVKVRGSIDSYALRQYKLMPMGNGRLFLPVKAAIRKKIKKHAGDYAKVVLYADDTKFGIPDEIRACFANEPAAAYQNFCAFTEGQQKAYIDWVYEAKTEDTKADRIVKMMDGAREKRTLQALRRGA